ncbi:MAG TPA: lysophospholipid acyltransferase family protein [Spirochaetota bacterium]|nr:lysophospholipid acyltransferase family protein [Spirochaetota bacterium]HPJ36234.1 lysophospholipid acyltransferase family protein [Spirochaetota bacterium]
MINKTVTALFLIYFCITAAVLFIPAVIIWFVTLPFDRRRAILHLYTCLWGSMYTSVVPTWRIKVTGKKNFQKGKAYIIAANHQSQLDILVACRLLKHFKWVSKEEILKIPFIGWTMRLNRYVTLKRGNMESVEQMMLDCEERLKQGSPVFFFPEGTRSTTGKVKLFKPGAFMLAHRLKLPVLPVVISGTCEALPKYSISLNGTKNISMKVLPEIPYSSFASQTITETAMMVRNIVKDELDRQTGAA